MSPFGGISTAPPIDQKSLRWMKPADFRNFTDDQICQVFFMCGARFLDSLENPYTKNKSVAIVSSSKTVDYNMMEMVPNGGPTEISFHKANSLYRCQSAFVMTDENNDQFLVLPHGVWQCGVKKRPAFFIREAYVDHWEIIYDHLVSKKKNQRVIISGTPGTGKSVEGQYLLHRIFDTYAENPPPVLYATTSVSNICLVHLRGMFFQIDDHMKFEGTWAYDVMKAHGDVWHVYDSTCPSNRLGWEEDGPTIIISSPGRAAQKDLKNVKKTVCLTLYLPLPSLREMQVIRRTLFIDEDDEDFVSEEDMLSLTNKYGCIPRTVFDFGKSKETLKELEAHLNNTVNVERLLNMVGSSVVDHDVASGKYVHIVPYIRPSFEVTEINADTPFPKRPASAAELEPTELSHTERLKFLRERYTTIVYAWASDYIRDHAFEAFLKLAPDRMMTIILSRPEATLGGFRGLILEPFVHKLLNETGVVGRMRDLETGKDMGKVRLGPWKEKRVYFEHSQLKPDENVYNMPHKPNEGAVDSLVPYDGYCFQITVSGNHPINRPTLDMLMQTNIFSHFKARKPKKPVQFVFIVEPPVFAIFKKQPFEGTKKEPYKTVSLRDTYPGIVQRVFEVDMRTVYQFHETLKSSKPLNMTHEKMLTKLENAVKKVTPSLVKKAILSASSPPGPLGGDSSVAPIGARGQGD